MPVFLDKAQTDASYERLTRTLFDAADAIYPAIAGHNLRSLSHAIAAARERGLPREAWEIQMLYGMAEPLQRAIAEHGVALAHLRADRRARHRHRLSHPAAAREHRRQLDPAPDVRRRRRTSPRCSRRRAPAAAPRRSVARRAFPIRRSSISAGRKSASGSRARSREVRGAARPAVRARDPRRARGRAGARGGQSRRIPPKCWARSSSPTRRARCRRSPTRKPRFARVARAPGGGARRAAPPRGRAHARAPRRARGVGGARAGQELARSRRRRRGGDRLSRVLRVRDGAARRLAPDDRFPGRDERRCASRRAAWRSSSRRGISRSRS